MYTRSAVHYIPPTAIFRSRNGNLIHQPVIAGQLRGLGDVSIAPTRIAQTTPGYTAIPRRDVAITRTNIRREETLRFAPAGPGLPGSFISSSSLRAGGGSTSASTRMVDVGVDPETIGHMAAGIWNAAQTIVGCSGESWCRKGSYVLVSTALRQLRPNAWGLLDPRMVRGTLRSLDDAQIDWVDLTLARNGVTTIRGMISAIDSGQYAGRAESPSSGTGAAATIRDGLMRSRDFILRSGGDVAPSEQPTGTGVVMSEEEMNRLREGAGLPPVPDASSTSDFLQGLSFGQIAGAVTGFAVGLGLLLLRRK
jgi:hypothetical protein